MGNCNRRCGSVIEVCRVGDDLNTIHLELITEEYFVWLSILLICHYVLSILKNLFSVLHLIFVFIPLNLSTVSFFVILQLFYFFFSYITIIFIQFSIYINIAVSFSLNFLYHILTCHLFFFILLYHFFHFLNLSISSFYLVM